MLHVWVQTVEFVKMVEKKEYKKMYFENRGVNIYKIFCSPKKLENSFDFTDKSVSGVLPCA